MRKFFVISIVLTIFGCAVNVSTYVNKEMPPLPDEQHITVFGLSDKTPENSQVIALIGISDDTGFSVNCDYNEVVNKAIEKSRRLGGNALKITSIETPDFFSTCYRISATVLYIDSPSK